MIVGSVLVLSGLALWQLGHAQIVLRKGVGRVGFVGEQPDPNRKFSSAVRFPKDSKAQQAIRSAADLIQDQNWPKACEALQFLLSRPEDGFIRVKRNGNNTITTSIRNEANRLLGTMPKDGLEIYEAMYGARAKIDLDEAQSHGDAHQLAEVALKYLHTKAGARAVELLGTRCLERDEPMMAALYFERLLNRSNADDFNARVFFKAALAFTRSRDSGAADEVWKKLEIKSRRDGGILLGGEIVSLDRAREEMRQLVSGEPLRAYDHVCFRGSPDRIAQGIGGHPFLEPTWRASSLPRLTDIGISREDRQRAHDRVKEMVDKAASDLGGQFQQPLLPAFFPITVGDKLIWRTYDGLRVLDLKKQKESWWFDCDGGASHVFASANVMPVDQWTAAYSTSGPKTVLFENSVIGTLSSDGTRVFAIDDLVLPPYLGNTNRFQPGWGNGGLGFAGKLAEQVDHNILKAFNLESGKLVWELGGNHDQTSLRGSFFLGAPLPLGGKLYVLVEKSNELRLVCLEPKDVGDSSSPPEIRWSQVLANTKDPIQFDLHRRLHTAQLAYSDGILVCPTNAGAVLGVELLTHSLAWAYSYRESDDPNGKGEAKGQGAAFPPNIMMQMRGQVTTAATLNNEWRVSAPAIHQGKVVFTAPDGKSIHCVNLKDGRQHWCEHRQEGSDLYFAGLIHGKALIVGKNRCRALNLVKGETVWQIENTGLPSGQGAASDNIYYLPVRAAADTKDPEVLAIDVERGVVLAHTKSHRRDGQMEVPGNLVFHDGQVISQTITDIKSYPQLQVKLNEIDQLLSKNPRDARSLLERGELRLDKGELHGANDDLHQALAVLGPNPAGDRAELLSKTRVKLHECLTEMLQREFSRGERYLDEYQELCKLGSPAEQLKRQGNFYCLLAKGREDQGRLLEAFNAYLAFAGLGKSNDLVAVIDQPHTSSCRDVWTRGRIAAMMARATVEQRRPLENKITEQWRALQDSNNLDELRKFVSLFGAAFQVGKQAKLRLAEHLLLENKEEGLREAQLLLLPLRASRAAEPRLAGQAVETLARLMIQKGSLDHATHYYAELGRDFAEVVIRDGKTGADLYRELATDKRFLPYLESSRPAWNGRFGKGVSTQDGIYNRMFLTLEPVGNPLPYFQRHRLALEIINPQGAHLCIFDQDTGKECFKSANLPGNQAQMQNGFQNVRVPYYPVGHVVTFQVGYMVYCFDVVDQKKLWEFNLYAPGQKTAPQNMQRDPRDGLIKEFFPAEGFMRRLGQLGPVQPSYVCMQTPKGLVAVDPLQGTILWTKTGVSLRTEIFGDNEYVYLVELAADGLPASARQAIRAADGVLVPVPDFTQAYKNKLRVIGRNLLVKEITAKQELLLRLHDVHAGKDLWQRTYPAGSIALKPDEGSFGGAIEPDGALTVLDFRTCRTILQTTLNQKGVLARRNLDITKALDKVTDAYLLHDHDLFYIALNKPTENNGIWMNVHQLRCLPVNGMIYAFERERGAKPGNALRWAELVSNQMLVMEQFQELPLLLFTSRHMKLVRNGAQVRGHQVQSTLAIQKRTGLSSGEEETMNNAPFYAVQANAAEGIVDFLNLNGRLRYKLEAVAAR